MIYDFIQDVCNILNISIPSVSFDTSNFLTKTTMAQVDISNNTIYIKKFDKPNPDQFFAIAHELRHIWQVQNDESYFFDNYVSSDLCNSVEDYNLQIAEIDANAFAGLVMISFFGLKPLFKGVPDSIKTNIYKHMEHLKTIEFFQ